MIDVVGYCDRGLRRAVGFGPRGRSTSITHADSGNPRGLKPAARGVLLGIFVLALLGLSVSDVSAAPASAGDGLVEGVASNWLEAVLFYVLAIATVICILGVCLSRSVVRMAVWLFMALALVGMLYFLLSAPFLGAIQFIVYVGGTMILLVFGVMLTSKSPWARFDARPWEYIGAGVVCLGLFATLCALFAQAGWTHLHPTTTGVAVKVIGQRLVYDYVLPFEVAGVLLFIVMVGAAHLARDTKK